MVCALALLPNGLVDQGFDIISRQFKDSKRWERFESYWKKQWAEANISVYGMVHRTNNYSESLNRTINLLIGRKRPGIWKLIYNLKIVEMLKSDELEQVVAGAMLKTRRKKRTIILNQKIKDATDLFNESKNVEAFLKNVTYNEDIESFFHKDGDGDVFNDVGSEDYDIIPNDYNVMSDFRLAHPRVVVTEKRKTSCEVVGNPKKQKKIIPQIIDT